MTDKIYTPLEEQEYDPATNLEPVKETCVAHFLGGPLDGVRDPAFIWQDAYLNGGAFYAFGHWYNQGGEMFLIGTSKYDIKVNKHKPGERLITCVYEGFSREGCE